MLFPRSPFGPAITVAALLLAAGAPSSLARGQLPTGPLFDHNFSSDADAGLPGASIHFVDPQGLTFEISHFDIREHPPLLGHPLPEPGTAIFDDASVHTGFDLRSASQNPPSRRHSIDQRREDLLITGPSSPPVPGAPSTYTIEMLKLNIGGGTLPPEMLLRESPSLPSLGQLTVTTPFRGNTPVITGFFDVFFELSLDSGQTWLPASAPLHMTYGPTPGAATLALLAPVALLRRRR